jgi:hypothetical protein
MGVLETPLNDNGGCGNEGLFTGQEISKEAKGFG